MVQVILIFLVFALIHSVTVTPWFKHFCKKLLGDTFMRVWYRMLYNAVSFVTVLIALHFIAREPDRLLWTAPLWGQWPLRVLQLAGLALGALAFEHLDGAEFMGFRQVGRYLSQGEVAGNTEGLTQKELVTGGVYGIVRHPLYASGIVIVTLDPHITVNSLTITMLTDFYFIFGMFIEERRFLALYEGQYREYMKRVPRLVPRFRSSGGPGRHERSS